MEASIENSLYSFRIAIFYVKECDSLQSHEIRIGEYFLGLFSGSEFGRRHSRVGFEGIVEGNFVSKPGHIGDRFNGIVVEFA